jgi:hypothetical protein
MADPKPYRQAEKRLLKLDKDLNAALGKLEAVRADGKPDQATKARQAAEALEIQLEAAYHDTVEAHTAYWAERQAEERALIRDNLEQVARYRWAAYCRGQGHHRMEVAVHEVIQALGTYPTTPPAEYLDGVPVAPPEPEALDRAETVI